MCYLPEALVLRHRKQIEELKRRERRCALESRPWECLRQPTTDVSTRAGHRRRMILANAKIGPGVVDFSFLLTSSHLSAIHPAGSYSLSYSVGTLLTFSGMALWQEGDA